jgi:fructose/tagatose bisphosphate aldolase
LLDHAAEHKYGVPAFNINNMEQALAIGEAAVIPAKEFVTELPKAHTVIASPRETRSVSRGLAMTGFA